jgi:hypothetical protein
VPSTGGTEASINFVRKGGKVTKVDKQKHANCCKCGRKHEIRNRPAFGKQCHKCKGKNHFSKMCKTRRNPQVHAIEPGTSDSENEFCINSVETKGKSENDWNVSVYCEGKQVNMKIDTGAQCNVMSMDYADLSVHFKETAATI